MRHERKDSFCGAVKISLPRALPKRTRQLVESAIERHQAATVALIAFLDEADGDADLEPSLAGASSGIANYDCEGDEADREPSLGWTEAARADATNRLYPQQWAGTADLEVDRSDCEPGEGDLMFGSGI